MTPYPNVTPIRDDITIDQRYNRDLVRALNADVDKIAREARDKGRIEGAIAIACFVVTGLVAGFVWPI